MYFRLSFLRAIVVKKLCAKQQKQNKKQRQENPQNAATTLLDMKRLVCVCVEFKNGTHQRKVIRFSKSKYLYNIHLCS